MRFLKTSSRLVILLSIFCTIQYSAAAEEKAQEEKNVAPERFTRQTESKSHLLAVAANPVAAASNDLDPLPRNKRQLGSLGVSLACSALCGALADGIIAPCEKICKKLGAIILPLLKDDGLTSVLKNVLGSVLSGRSAGGPCPCPLIYRPVCAFNGETYDNACVAKCDGQRVARNGKCEESSEESYDELCFCTKIYDPVCGNDGNVYPNPCEAGCKGVGIHHKGPCAIARTAVMGRGIFPCFCAKTYNPVCGTDGKTYSNSCTSKCAGVGVAFSGPCLLKSRSRVGCVCPLLYWPVCGVNGVKYPNKCELRCAGVALAYPVRQGGMERECVPIWKYK